MAFFFILIRIFLYRGSDPDSESDLNPDPQLCFLHLDHLSTAISHAFDKSKIQHLHFKRRKMSIINHLIIPSMWIYLDL